MKFGLTRTRLNATFSGFYLIVEGFHGGELPEVAIQ